MLLDTTHTEGGGDWCGTFVGTSFIFSDRGQPRHARGRPALLLRRQPDAAGPGDRHRRSGARAATTGTVGSHDAAARGPSGRRARARRRRGPRDRVESAYRFLVADALPFGKNARIQLEHGASTTRRSTIARSRTGTAARRVPRADRRAARRRHLGRGGARLLVPRHASGVDTLDDELRVGRQSVGARRCIPADRHGAHTRRGPPSLARDPGRTSVCCCGESWTTATPISARRSTWPTTARRAVPRSGHLVSRRMNQCRIRRRADRDGSGPAAPAPEDFEPSMARRRAAASALAHARTRSRARSHRRGRFDDVEDEYRYTAYS